MRQTEETKLFIKILNDNFKQGKLPEITLKQFLTEMHKNGVLREYVLTSYQGCPNQRVGWVDEHKTRYTLDQEGLKIKNIICKNCNK